MNSDLSQSPVEELIELGGYPDESAQHDKKPRKSQADRLVELANHVEFFHQDVDEPFASVKIGDHVETWAIRSNGFRRWLSREFWIESKKAPSSQSLQDALSVLAGRAIHDGKQISVHTRVAEHDGKLYLDLADIAWRSIEITPQGWSILKDAPVKFVRTRGMLEIPEPKTGGNLNELRQFLNIADDDAFALIKAFLVSTLRPNLPFAFLAFTGEQGSGKTSLSIKLKSIVDPGKAAVRGLPREVRDLAIAAGNAWLLAFDNISTIQTWTSDALCSLSTGGGFSTRELYSDSDEKIFDYQRPMILNGIGDIVTRPDLLDRCIVLQLPVIPEENRRLESELNRMFEAARPSILGALLDAGVMALQKLSSVRLKNLPRMADFVVWAVAAESAHSNEPIFLRAYRANRAGLNQVAIDASMIGPPILQLMDTTDRWDGVVGELLEALNGIASDAIKRSKSWPATPRNLSGELRRIAPNLRTDGIEVTFGKHIQHGRELTLERVRKSPSEASGPSASNKRNDLNRDGSAPHRQASSATVSDLDSKPLNPNNPDDADETDGLFRVPSYREERL